MTRRIGFVAIGRNEGERLIACLASLKSQSKGAQSEGPIVYVDSGSTDGSVEAAQRLGAIVVNLDMSAPFTAARARNEGFKRLLADDGPEEASQYVQFIDGDCTLADGWLETAAAFLDANGDVAAVCGRRRERQPEASLYNRLCDIEWATPIGEADACGGDALMRAAAVAAAGGYRNSLVAGEEPELCLRLREAGWRIFRLDAEMTLHDAAIFRLSQWWKRVMRGGHAYAEVSTLHAASSKRIWRREMWRALAWSALAPLAVVAGALAHPGFFLLLLAYPAQIARLWRRERARLGKDALAFAVLSVLAKFAEAQGAATYFLRRASGKRSQLIEYK